MTSKSRKSLLTLIVGALVVALLFIAFRPHPVAVDLAPVTRGPMQVTINADGKTKIRNLYEVSAPIAGTALRSPVEEGDGGRGGCDRGGQGRTHSRPRSLTPGPACSWRPPCARPVPPSRSRRRAVAAVRRRAVLCPKPQYERTKALVARGVSSLTALEDAQQLLSLRVCRPRCLRLERPDGRILTGTRRGCADRDRGRRFGLAKPAVSRSPHQPTVPSSAITQVSEHAVAVGSPLLSTGDVADLEIEADLLSSDARGS